MPFAPNALQVRRHGGLGDRTLIALQLNRHFGQKIVISSSPGTPLHASQRGPGGSETVRGLRNASLSLRMWYGNISAFTSNVVHNLYSRWTMHPPVTRNVSMVAYKHWHSSITHPPDFTNQSKHRSGMFPQHVRRPCTMELIVRLSQIVIEWRWRADLDVTPLGP